jgi:polyhydroxybutyrate depolymerase
VGHSNGGFMAHRMACDRAARVAAIVSLAGAQWSDPSRCAPTEAVSVLQVHGLDDDTILYMGGSTAGTDTTMYPGARATVAAWGRLNRCGDFADTGMTFDYVTAAPGNETHVGRHAGCMGGAAELWSMDATGHIPAFSPAWAEAVIDWLEMHPKPAR